MKTLEELFQDKAKNGKTFLQRYAELAWKRRCAVNFFGSLGIGITFSGGLYGQDGLTVEEYDEYSAIDNFLIGFIYAHDNQEELVKKAIGFIEAEWDRVKKKIGWKPEVPNAG